jgi:hypothetical protein
MKRILKSLTPYSGYVSSRFVDKRVIFYKTNPLMS